MAIVPPLWTKLIASAFFVPVTLSTPLLSVAETAIISRDSSGSYWSEG